MDDTPLTHSELTELQGSASMQFENQRMTRAAQLVQRAVHELQKQRTVTAATVVRVQPGDVITVTGPAKYQHALGETVGSMFPRCEILVLPEGTELQVFRPDAK